ncbi:MAG: response regulator transcription factor [Balneola sp.]
MEKRGGLGKIKVAIVEDHDIFRKRLMELLGFYEDLELIFTAASAESCLSFLKEMEEDRIPDVILMDIELPGISGIEATFLIKEKQKDMDIIMFTVFEDDERLFQSIQVGATGYLLKDTPIDQVVSALKEVKEGGSPITPSIARKLMGMVSKPETKESNDQDVIPFDLSPAELRILEQVIDGKSNKEIAEAVFLSPWTVKTHIKNIYKKMHVNSRAAAVRLALKREII